MLKRNDTLPFILALISTLVVLGLGFGVWSKINSSTTAHKGNNQANNNQKVSANNGLNEANSALAFSDPAILPMGLSVKINGSEQMKTVNQTLKQSFQKAFPGTNVDYGSDGGETGMRLLVSGQVDLAAISRPLNDDEKAKGLTAVNVLVKSEAQSESSNSEEMFYAYREPANMKVEAFLGHLFSAQAQKAIVNP